jgi:DNA-binding LytR/AlgR family response regulator
MKRFVISAFSISAFSILLAASAVVPAAQAAEANSEKAFNVQQVRLANLDQRNKNLDVKPGFSIQKVRLTNLDRRNKVGDKVSTTSLVGQRHRLLDK